VLNTLRSSKSGATWPMASSGVAWLCESLGGGKRAKNGIGLSWTSRNLGWVSPWPGVPSTSSLNRRWKDTNGGTSQLAIDAIHRPVLMPRLLSRCCTPETQNLVGAFSMRGCNRPT